MKVLKDNYKNASVKEAKEVKPYPRKHTCEQCGSELEYDKNDLRMGALGCVYLDCPCCGYDNMLEENENSITLTADNIEFPTHFFHTSVATGAVDNCNNEEVINYIRKAIKYFRKNKEEFAWQGGCGTLHVGVYKYDGDENYEVIITKDYYSTYIPFENEDYED